MTVMTEELFGRTRRTTRRRRLSFLSSPLEVRYHKYYLSSSFGKTDHRSSTETTMEESSSWVKREFYGGAITCEIPSDWRDVSDVRQVPDHQECWQEMDGAVLVVEILERQNVPDLNAADFFFRDLAEANGAVLPQDGNFVVKPISGAGANEEIKKVQALPSDATIVSGVGSQKVAMGRDTDIAGNPRQQEVRWIQVNLAAYRLQSKNTDLLVTMSVPLGSVPSPDAFPTNFDERFVRIFSSLKIQDWSLFG
jgi:hypothetical protein